MIASTQPGNLLPYDGIVQYFGRVISETQADHFFSVLLDTIEWRHDEAIMFGKKITTKRKVAWYGDEPYPYTYSKITKSALPWTPELLKLKQLAENHTGDQYNSCLLNLYHNGEEGMGWHSDDEKELKNHAAIGSFSLGAERKFVFKHKTTKEKVELKLENGSFLVMSGATQHNWLHRLPPTKRIKDPRINLTFRTMD